MNSIQLIGRLTADPELRFTNGGTATCTIRLAVPRRRTKGEAEPAPVFVNVVTYGNQAEAVAEHMAKGRRVSVTGRLEYREWTTDDVRHSIHEVVASQVEFQQTPKDGNASSAAAGRQPLVVTRGRLRSQAMQAVSNATAR